MTKINFNKEMIEEAVRMAHNLGSLRNSITSGAGNIAGYIGELALAEALPGSKLVSNESKKYDLFYNNSKVEIKTKRRTVDPRDFYEVSIAHISTHQRPDIYAFVSLTFAERGKVYKKLKSVWVCGFYLAEKYFEEAALIKKGQKDPSNGFVCHCDMYNMPIKNLWTLRKCLTTLEK